MNELNNYFSWLVRDHKEKILEDQDKKGRNRGMWIDL